ncbi:c-type cytochrome [Runella sp. CRIBMP]|uniref:PVC-type heme-binding CxxCH protein n=1 Tax=Runella sp. CRIBMP TaxID=2683261 RepID=UPI0014124A82|nr:PVC-type heme-binding CxxCH protein [Runella sp. CRIBMP]NBB21497.1 c-type cytochrome [Runella sp. CRIBMP]
MLIIPCKFIHHKNSPVMRYVALVCLLTVFSFQKNTPPKLSPEHQKALESLRVMEGFSVEMVAAEPLIADPVAMEVDENGDMYVVEMHGYPLDVSGSGKVKLLKDTDNDGYPDKSIIFADKLTLPTGIMRWKNGFIVTDAPDVLYLEDTDNDGKANIRQKMLSGFALSNPQHNLNTPRFELDNWIYLGHEGAVTPFVFKKEFGDKGTDIIFPDKPSAARLAPNANGKAVRFKPDSYELEELSGRTQYGHSMDAWGHRFYTSNANHIYHEVLANTYLKNNPALLVPNATQNISDHGEAAEIYPITETPNHQLLTDVGVITSSCGITWYRGGAFGEKFNNVTFIAEPVHNLVHADIVRDAGASFTASRLNEKSEFLASKDAWFRPVNFYTGPDGALYVIDYYRQIVEHPEWMSDEITQSGALYNGTDKGRIYRIVPHKGLPMNWLGKLNLSKKSAPELVTLLDHENSWYRRTAQRLLLHRQAKEAIPALHALVTKSKFPEAKAHALWLLDGIQAIEKEDIVQALKSETAGVRENAIRVAERYLNAAFGKELINELTTLHNDDSPKVRFQLLNTLGLAKTVESEKARLAILKRDIHDRWAGLASIASFAGKENQIFDVAIAEFTNKSTSETSEFIANLASTIAGGENKTGFSEMMKKIMTETKVEEAWKAAALNGVAKRWQYQKGKGTVLLSEPEKEKLLANFAPTTSPELRMGSLSLLEITGFSKGKRLDEKIAQAISALKNPSTLTSQGSNIDVYRAHAIAFLAMVNSNEIKPISQQILTQKEPEVVQLAALKALGKSTDMQTYQFLLNEMKGFAPALKKEAVNVFLSKPERINVLLKAIETKEIEKSVVGWQQMVRLMNYYDTGIRAYARKVLSVNEDRKAVLQKYMAALELKGNQPKGQLVFEKNCATCHQIEGVKGVNFGPDLSTLRSRNAQSVLTEIINPNNSIADMYDFWTLELKNGSTVAGIIAQENTNNISLREMGGMVSVIQKKDISKMQKAEQSIMPNGLENAISIQEMADLIAFIKRQ